MTVRKFVGKDSRSVMQQIRKEMGHDAMILSNRTVAGGVEFLVLTQEDVDLLASAATIDNLSVRVAKPDSYVPSLGCNPHGTDMTGVISEIRSMRTMLETQIVDIAWGASQKQDPSRVAILRETLDAGFSPALARYLANQFSATGKCTPSEALNWTKTVLADNLNCQSDDSKLLAGGGAFALIGPTGVGKTTTTAKLAAKFVMQHGPGKLALITTDNYRIAGHEQLRTYGRLLGVMVHTVTDEVEMRIALDELKNKHTILIDTVGMSQRDKRVVSQIAMLRNSSIKRLLCISATAQMGTLEEVVQAYGEDLTGTIITKLDEAATLGGVLDVIIRNKLPLYYIANGQRVPEDLLIPDGPKLIDRVFSEMKLARQFQILESELTLLMSHATSAPFSMQGHAS